MIKALTLIIGMIFFGAIGSNLLKPDNGSLGFVIFAMIFTVIYFGLTSEDL